MARKREFQGERLPATRALQDAVLALRALRESYARLFERGRKEKRWDRCVHRYGAAVHALEDPDLTALVDGTIGRLHNAGNGAPDRALDVLNDCYRGKWRVEELERELGRGAGFSDGDLRRHLRNARRSLKRAAKSRGDLPHVVDTAGLVRHLGDIQALAQEVILQPNTGIKREERPYAKEQIDARLYMVIEVVANSDYGEVFNYSYAAGLGAAAHPGRERKHLKKRGRSLPRGIPTPAPSGDT